MKKFIVGAILAGVLAGSAAIYAGDGCCGMSKSCDQAGSCQMFSKLNLSADQKAKIADLKAQCAKDGWSAATHEKFMKGVEAILTPEQRVEWKAACDKMSKDAHATPQADTKS